MNEKSNSGISKIKKKKQIERIAKRRQTNYLPYNTFFARKLHIRIDQTCL